MKVFSKQACRFVRELPGVPYVESETVIVSSAVVTEVPEWIRTTSMWQMLIGQPRSIVILEDAESGLTLDEGLAAYPQIAVYLNKPGNNSIKRNALGNMHF
jgi:hypothetical protein